jgi:predicted transposase YbfD/YdcC
MLCGAKSESAIAEWGINYGTKWLKRLGFKRATAPRQPTIHRIFKGLDRAAFERAISRWVASLHGEPAPLEGVAVDGKAARGALKQGATAALNKTTGEIREETVYGVTSLSAQRATPAQLNGLWRKHWTIENKLHWVLDVTFNEDRSTVRTKSAPQVMAALRNVAITSLRFRKVKNIAAALRRYAA